MGTAVIEINCDMGGACCSDRPVPAITTTSQLPKDINLVGLKKVQDDLSSYNREISRCKETLIYLNDETSSIEQRLSSVDQRYSELYLDISALHDKAKGLMTLKMLQSTIEVNLSKPGFERILHIYGKGSVIRRLTSMETPSSTEGAEIDDGTTSQLTELMEADEPAEHLESRIEEVIESAKQHIPALSDLLLQLHSFEIRVVGIKTQIEGPILASIEKRCKALRHLRTAQQENLLRCIVHETAITDYEKILRPTQTLDQFQAAERYNLDHRKECEYKEKQLDLLISAIRSKVRETSNLKQRTEDIATKLDKDLKSRSINLRIPATGGDVEIPDDLSSLDLGDTHRPSRLLSLDAETEDYYQQKINELKKLLKCEDSKARQSQFTLQMKEEQVSVSRDKLSCQKLKSMYFVFVHYLDLLKARSVQRWKLMIEEDRNNRKRNAGAGKVITIVGIWRREALEGAWDKLTGQEELGEDIP